MELAGVPAIELARMVRDREAGAVEVVEAHIRRIVATHDAINAVVQLDAERALDAARVADRADPRGPLHGVPFTVKDNLEAAGIPMAIGAPERAGVVPDGAATVVTRLKDAGAILLGKTNCPTYGGGIETDNPVYGRTSPEPHGRAEPLLREGPAIRQRRAPAARGAAAGRPSWR